MQYTIGNILLTFYSLKSVFFFVSFGVFWWLANQVAGALPPPTERECAQHSYMQLLIAVTNGVTSYLFPLINAVIVTVIEMGALLRYIM